MPAVRRPRMTLAWVAVLVLAARFTLSSAPPASADGVLIPAPARVDMVHDVARDILYITNGSSILRYNMASDSFLDPITISAAGEDLGGIDLSEDGGYLIAADRNPSASGPQIHVVYLPNLSVRTVTFPRDIASGETGTWTVAFARDGTALVSSRSPFSVEVPLRRVDSASTAFMEIARVYPDTMLTPGAGIIAFSENQQPNGRWGRYDPYYGTILRGTITNQPSGPRYEIGVDHSAMQYAIPSAWGCYIFNNAFSQINTVGFPGAPVGLVYHPSDDIVYFAWGSTTQVRAHSTTDFGVIATYEMGEQFNFPVTQAFNQGRLRISPDGSVVFCTVTGGVRYLRIYATLHANDKTVANNEDSPGPVGLSVTMRPGYSPTSYQIVTQPVHGTLTGTAPYLTYIPNTDYNGPDSFTFRAKSGTVWSNVATESITVNAVNDAPGFTAGANVTVAEDSGLKSVAGWATSISPGPANEAGQTLTFLVAADKPALFSGQPAISSTGTLSFTPAPNANGTATVTVRLKDGGGTANGGIDTSPPITFNISISPVNDPPIAANDSVSITPNSAVNIAVLANDSDVDGDKLTVTAAGPAAHGTVSINADGTIRYVPVKNFKGTDTFTYSISDGHGGTASAAVKVSVGNGK